MEYSEHVTDLDDFLKREEEQFRDLGETFEETSLDDVGETTAAVTQFEIEEEHGEFIRDPMEHRYSDMHDRHGLELQDNYEVEDEKEGVHREMTPKSLIEE